MLSQFMEALDMGSLELEVVSERRVWCFLVVQLFSEGRGSSQLGHTAGLENIVYECCFL